jgi:hypothetical protein
MFAPHAAIGARCASFGWKRSLCGKLSKSANCSAYSSTQPRSY